MDKLLRLFGVVAVALVIWFLPHTPEISDQGWHLLAIFTATIVGFILRPYPTGVMAFMGSAAAVATSSIKMNEALLGYAEPMFGLLCRPFSFLEESSIQD